MSPKGRTDPRAVLEALSFAALPHPYMKWAPKNQETKELVQVK
jgi:hypothetical protein